MSGAKRTPGDVLRETRKKDSQTKRAKVLAMVDAMKAKGDAITFLAVARTAGVSRWLVYAEGVREHIEAAMKSQAKSERARSRPAGMPPRRAWPPTWPWSVRRTRLCARSATASRRPSSARWEPSWSRPAQGLTARVNELLAAVERITLERDEIRAERDALQRRLRETQDDLAAARAAGKEMFKRINRT
jgi:hypothetical protein